MPGAIFSRVKNWVAEKLTNEDLNAEIDNILTNFKPDQMDDYSVNVAQMRVTADPGEDGTESLATTMAGELARLRFALGELKGTSYWYETADSSISELASALGGGGLADNRIISGLTSANSSQIVALKPPGNTNTLTLDATPTPFQYSIEGTTYSISADVTAIGLISAPTTNNTALINDANAADEQLTTWQGMYGTTIQYDTAGSEITSRDGQLVGFKLYNGSATEYFIGRIDDANNLIKDCWRGCFFNNTPAGIPAVAFSNNDTLTLMKLTWVFATTAGTLKVVYNEPRHATTAPVSPSTGDYWFDFTTDKWQIFDSSSWVDADATLIGLCIQDESGNTVGARTFDANRNYNKMTDVGIRWLSNTEVRTDTNINNISIYGTKLQWKLDQIRWNITTDLASGLTEAASTYYFLYLKENGTSVMDVQAPLDRRGDLSGWYHPHESWRYVGSIYNNGSSNISTADITSICKTHEQKPLTNDMEIIGSMKEWGSSSIPTGWVACSGGTLAAPYYKELHTIIGANFTGGGTDTFAVPDTRGRSSIGVGTGSGLTNRALGFYYGNEDHIHRLYDYTNGSTTASIYNASGTSNTISTGTRTGGVQLAGTDGSVTTAIGEDMYTESNVGISLHPVIGLYKIIKAF